MIILKDTFNDRIISRHRSVAAAVKARSKHSRMISRVHGKGSFLRYSIIWNTIRSEDGSDIYLEILACEEALRYGGAK